MTDPNDAETTRLLAEALGTEQHAAELLSGHAWRRLCRTLEQAERLVGPADAECQQAEGYRYLARFLAAGLRSCVTHDDPDYPVLQRMIDYATPWGLDHPDCLYLYASLRGNATYRLFGNRGSANVLDMQINSGHFSAGRVDAIKTLASLDGAGLNTDENGNFELLIGPDVSRTAGLRVGADARFLHIRQYFADWDRERPAELLVERVDAAWPIPAPRAALVGRQLDTLSRWIELAGAQWDGMSKRLLSMPANSMVVHNVMAADAQGALAGQVYGMGNFDCGPDEAVVVRFSVPSCAHWNVSLSNRFWECIEYASRQSSLNQQQAVSSPDRTIHCVIAHDDPGYANWLDPAGNQRGTLALRMHQATGKPEVHIERMALAAAESRLPADTPRIDPATRAAGLRRRRHAVLRRFRT